VRIGIVGAGMLGLVAALRLRQAGHDVTLIERDTVPGGLAAGFVPVAGGDPLERFYHHIFRTDESIVALIGEMGLADDLVWKRPVTTCLYEGELHQLDSAATLLRFGALPLFDRLRLGAALGLLKAYPSVRPFEPRTATSWLRRFVGDRAYGIVFDPLFRSKFGSFADRVSLGWFWARIHDRTTDLGYLQGGFHRLYRALAERLRELGATVLYETTATRVREENGGVTIETATRGALAFDRVIATVPLRVLARIAPAIEPAYVERYSPVASLWADCIVLALDRPLSDAYWINICEQGERAMPFMVLVEHTNFVSPERYGGRHLVYVGRYCETPPEDLDAGTIERLAPHLRVLNPAFSPDWVTASWRFRAPFAQPIVTPDYRARIAPIETPVPGLFVANLEQVYPHDRGQNYAIELAGRASEIAVRDAGRARAGAPPPAPPAEVPV
jgi:protoporphyrinogen oxidase